jgi:hypothetical protein
MKEMKLHAQMDDGWKSQALEVEVEEEEEEERWCFSKVLVPCEKKAFQSSLPG